MNADGIRGILLGISAIIGALMPVVLWQLARIHTVVNSNFSKLTKRVDQLSRALQADGKTIPSISEGDDPPEATPS